MPLRSLLCNLSLQPTVVRDEEVAHRITNKQRASYLLWQESCNGSPASEPSGAWG